MQNRAGQIDAVNLGRFVFPPVPMSRLGPQPQADAALRSPRSSRPLIGGCLGDIRKFQPIKSRLLIVPLDAGEAAIDDGGYSFDGERSFGDVGRQDYFPPLARREDGVLLVGGQVAVEFHDGEI